MSKFFDDTMQGLLDAIEIEKGSIKLLYSMVNALGYDVQIVKRQKK